MMLMRQNLLWEKEFYPMTQTTTIGIASEPGQILEKDLKNIVLLNNRFLAVFSYCFCKA